jgi:uncharacterized protein YndB with AHSA1/START domain
MSRNTRHVDVPPATVWEVLADGWLYAVWVVGASRMREVEDAWPSVGSRIHHSVGVWPLLIDDHTEVLEAVPASLLRLHVRGWPAGAGEVTIRLTASDAGTEISMDEDAVAGPGMLVPAPLRSGILHWRNDEALRRLGYVAERRWDGAKAGADGGAAR